MAEDLKTAQPRGFYQQFLREGIRPDGRSLLDFRKVLLNVGSISTAEGSALVKFGNTMVVCGIKAELAVPSLENPDEGYLVPNVDLSPVCSPEFRPGPPSEKAQVLSQFLHDTIKSSGLISMKDLCILKGKLCWVLYADVFCGNHDGNLHDSSLTALLAALQNTQLPVVSICEETEKPQASDSETFRLNILNRPVSATFSLFDETSCLADPSHEEEDLAMGSITVVVGDEEKLCSVCKPGGVAVSDDIMENCILTAMSRAYEIRRLIDGAVEIIDR